MVGDGNTVKANVLGALYGLGGRVVLGFDGRAVLKLGVFDFSVTVKIEAAGDFT